MAPILPNRRLGRTRERRTLYPNPTPIAPQPEAFAPEAPATERHVQRLMTREPTPIGPRPDAVTRTMNADKQGR